MPYRYVLRWSRGVPERVSVLAYLRYPRDSRERRRPAFVIGRVSGSRLLALRETLNKAAAIHPTHSDGKNLVVDLDRDDETAYRIGLAAAVLSRARDAWDMERGTRYILNAMPEEVWFWTSKLLDEDVGERTLPALALLAGLRAPTTRGRRRSLSPTMMRGTALDVRFPKGIPG